MFDVEEELAARFHQSNDEMLLTGVDTKRKIDWEGEQVGSCRIRSREAIRGCWKPDSDGEPSGPSSPE
jgi:hypothetical protein